jgi:putative chitinase
MRLSLDELSEIFDGAERVLAFVDPLNDAMERWEIVTPERVSAFLANVAHESGNLSRLQENLSYSANRLMAVWPGRFPTLESTEGYARNPQALANKVYANRMENGDEASGDGWKYRGRGPIQATGKRNYRRYQEATHRPVLDVPDMMLDPVVGSDFAGWFWKDVGANQAADELDIAKCRRLVNGSTLGLDQVTAIYESALGRLKLA